jgi:hypothetical protein
MEEIYMTDYEKTKAFLDDIGIPYGTAHCQGIEVAEEYNRYPYLEIFIMEKESRLPGKIGYDPISFLFDENGKLVELGTWL